MGGKKGFGVGGVAERNKEAGDMKQITFITVQADNVVL